MKKPLLTSVALILFLASCVGGAQTGKPSATAQPDQTGTTLVATAAGDVSYPAPEQIQAETAYPIEVTSPGKRVIITDTPDVRRSPIIISDVIKTGDEEHIIIKNVTQSEQEITLFSILQVGLSENFNFPDRRLSPGETIEVYNGAGEISQDKGYKWKDQPLLAESGDQYVLLNRAGRMIWSYVYYP